MKQFLKQKTLLLTTVAGMLYCPISAQADICSFLTGETSGKLYNACEFAGDIFPEVLLAGPNVVQPLPMTPSATTGSPSFGSILPDGSLKINQPGTLHIHSTLGSVTFVL